MLTYFMSGMRVRCLKSINFMDGTSHKRGQIVTVTDEDLAYYQVNKVDYEHIN